MAELGTEAKRLGLQRVAVFTDPRIRALAPFEEAMKSLEASSVDVELFDEVAIEPTNVSFGHAIDFAQRFKPDGYISIGGGSVIDTAKAANLYATHPASFRTYVNAPVGDGHPVPGPLEPHLACPTTSGTGSECTGISIFDDLDLHAKTGIASRHLRPTRALIDPGWTRDLPRTVLACSGFDVLSHAMESLTARPYTRRPANPGAERPLSQGANPWSDIGCREALRLLGRYLVRAVNDAEDDEAREQVMWASTLAGIAFGNSGVHLPHGMSYAVAGGVREFRPPDYPQEVPIVPHGMAVIVNAPAVFRAIASTSPERHLEAATLLGGEVVGAGPEDAGEAVAKTIIDMMRTTAMPDGLSGVGYGNDDVAQLTRGAAVQRRLLDNAPLAVDEGLLDGLFAGAMRYWS